MTLPIVYIALPTYDGTMQKKSLIRALVHPAGSLEKFNIVYCDHDGNSLLARGFNFEWANALVDHSQGKISHFAMLHGDVIPAHNWLGVLLDEMKEHGADVLSVVSPIKCFEKDGELESSTAVGVKGEIYEGIYRIPLSYIAQLPPTFSIDDIPNSEGRQLLVNTGCMLVKLGDWCHRLDRYGCLKVFFTIKDRIKLDDDKMYNVQVASEDWNFSRMCDQEGLKVMATSKVPLLHRGQSDFPNRMVKTK